MTATTSDEAALCAAIRANPDEDTPRLMYADWLDENVQDVECPYPHKCSAFSHKRGCNCGSGKGADSCPLCYGTGFIRDESRRVRAELIRVQVELAQINAAPIYTVEVRSRFLSLSPRESALAARLAAGWPGVLPPCPVCQSGTPDAIVTYYANGGEYCRLCNNSRRVGSWVRGMLSVPVPTLSTVFSVTGESVGNPAEGEMRTWLVDVPTTWARDELLARPWVCEVPILDREPCVIGRHRAWHEGDPNDEQHHIPKFIWDRLTGWQHCRDCDLCRGYDTPGAARTALARAAAQAAFSVAGGAGGR